jgi:hypothetical protein
VYFVLQVRRKHSTTSLCTDREQNDDGAEEVSFSCVFVAGIMIIKTIAAKNTLQTTIGCCIRILCSPKHRAFFPSFCEVVAGAENESYLFKYSVSSKFLRNLQ